MTQADQAESGTSITDPLIDYGILPELVGHNLGIAYVMIVNLFSRTFADTDMTAKQFVALEFISLNSKISQKEIAHHIGTTPTVMVSIVDHLVECDFVKRVPSSQDRRQQFLQITESGQKFLESTRRMAYDVEALFAQETGITVQERETLLKILRKITKR